MSERVQCKLYTSCTDLFDSLYIPSKPSTVTLLEQNSASQTHVRQILKKTAQTIYSPKLKMFSFDPGVINREKYLLSVSLITAKAGHDE